MKKIVPLLLLLGCVLPTFLPLQSPLITTSMSTRVVRKKISYLYECDEAGTKEKKC